jgi:hypothetical protein
MFLLVLFFGVLIYRYCKGHLRATTKVEGTIVEVMHSQSKPPVSYVKIEYTLQGKKVKIDEIVPYTVSKNDVLTFYVSSTGAIVFDAAFPLWVYWVLIVIYVLILLMSIWLIVRFHRK